MSDSSPSEIGSVLTLWRYPVKSMMGEELNASEITQRGLLGDRAYALVDNADGKVVSAKNPRKWPQMFEFHAALLEEPRTGAKMPGVRLTLPDGTFVSQNQSDLNQILSNALRREITLQAAGQTGDLASGVTSAVRAEAYWPDIEGLDQRDTVTDFILPEGTFFDAGVVNVLTTATLDRFRELYPQGRFEIPRFRPNVVVESLKGMKGFVENAWINHVLSIGDEVRLSITRSCLRCVMTTLPQGDLPADSGILRAITQHNKNQVGVYASVVRGGTIRRGDRVTIK